MNAKLKNSGPRRPSAQELALMPTALLVLFAVPSIGRVTHLFSRWLAGTLSEEVGLTPPRIMLMWLLSRFREPTMGEIASALDLTPRAITRLVDGLVGEGLVERVADSTDGRVFRIRLTPAGRRRFNSLEPKLRGHFVELFADFDKSEIRELIRLSEKLSDRMALSLESE